MGLSEPEETLAHFTCLLYHYRVQYSHLYFTHLEATSLNKEYFERFEKGVNRIGSGSAKWDSRESVFGRADVIPMWVADMDFPTPQPVVDALMARAAHPTYGYMSDGVYDPAAVVEWMAARHQLTITEEQLSYSPGVVDSMLICLSALTKPGDLVALQPPIYGPFYSMAERASLRIYRNALVQDENGWHMDLNHLEDGLKKGVKIMMLCSPHNPVGRVWTAEELDDLAKLCERYGCIILSDEIHMDITMPNVVHTPILNATDRAILLASATKTFNLAGLRHSSIVIRDPQIKKLVDDEALRMGIGSPNLFGSIAQTVAYRQGAPWLDALREYLDGNRAYVTAFFERKFPAFRVSQLQGTYLMWLDVRALGLYGEEPIKFFAEKAGVGLTGGLFFGSEGEGFVRINIAAPRATVEKSVKRMLEAVRAL